LARRELSFCRPNLGHIHTFPLKERDVSRLPAKDLTNLLAGLGGRYALLNRPLGLSPARHADCAWLDVNKALRSGLAESAASESSSPLRPGVTTSVKIIAIWKLAAIRATCLLRPRIEHVGVDHINRGSAHNASLFRVSVCGRSISCGVRRSILFFPNWRE
jgi:hypothetical protein